MEEELRSGCILAIRMLTREQIRVADGLDAGVGQREKSLLKSTLSLSNLKNGLDIY